MIQDGTVAVIFWLMALGTTALDGHKEGEAFKLRSEQAYGAYGISLASKDGEDVGIDGRVTWYPGISVAHIRPLIDISGGAGDGAFLGAGLAMQRDFEFGSLPMFAGIEFVPCMWLGSFPDELGSAFSVRSGVEVGVRMNLMDGARLSLMFDHRSNGDINDDNAGIETVGLRLHVPF
jgi:lipid A 3-O-deacylase